MSEIPTYVAGELRDRLANERTLLAWIRTALALMGFGLVVAKFGLFLGMLGPAAPPAGEADHARLVGTALVLAGVLIAAIGAQRTAAYARIIDPARRAPTDRALHLSVALVIALGLALTLYLARS